MKNRHNNRLGKKITISKDFIIDENCKICDDVVFRISVKLGNNVNIGKDVFIEKNDVDNESSIEGIVICTGFNYCVL